MASIVILTRNEAAALPRCLQALGNKADLHVVDSGSTDGTQAIAEQHGAKLYLNKFSSFAQQRNWALEHCALASVWVLFLDADEVATPMFLASVDAAVDSSDEIAGYYCCGKLIYRGRWLRRSDSFPRWQLRLLRKGRVKFCDFGHGQKEAEVSGPLEYIREPYLHYALDKGIGPWLERHNRYSDLEAALRISERINWRELFSRHGARRNKALKLLSCRLPFWPLIRFGWNYFLRGGFLEGRPGLIYCASISYYEFLIRIKIEEIRLPPPSADENRRLGN